MKGKFNLFSKKNNNNSNRFSSKFEVNEDDYNLINNSNFFSKKYYLKNYPDVKDLDMDPVVHYILFGYLKGYNPNFNFDNNAYIDANSDVKKAEINPLLHYLRWGVEEKREVYHVPSRRKRKIAGFKHNILNKLKSSKSYLFVVSRGNSNLFKQNTHEYNVIKDSGLFDEDFYRKTYPEVEEFNHDLILHYMFIGSKFNFKPNEFFDTNYYKNTYEFEGNPFYDYIINKEGREISFKQNIKNKESYSIIKNSELFDNDYYLENYPEVDIDPIWHYIYYGFKENYNPSEKFNTSWYLETYPEAKGHILNPLVHYIEIGKDNGNLPRPISKKEAENMVSKIDSNARTLPLKEFSDDAPLVSIVILNRNGLDYLKVLFKDFKETICYPNYEIIVVDNGSSDESVEYLKSLDLPLKVIENNSNESFSEANNKAVEESNGEYIVLLNNDMEPIYGWLNHMMETYLKGDDIGIVGAKLIFPFREDDPTALKTQNEGIKFMELNGFYEPDDGYTVPYNIKEGDVFIEDKEREIGSVLGASLLIKKDIYQELGGLDEEFAYNYEDIDLCFKAIDNGYKVVYNPNAQLYHYYQATRKEAFDLSPDDVRNRFYLYRKWNKWITERLFLDKLKNDMIFSDNPIKATFISVNDTIENTLGWDYNFMEYDINQKNMVLEFNTDIIISDIYDLKPQKLVKNNIHNVKVAIVKNNKNRWLESETLFDYNLILVNPEYYDELVFEFPNVFALTNENLLEQVANNLIDIQSKNSDKFNEIISNPDFVDALPLAKQYLAILNSKYFDREWYEKQYPEFKNYKGDSALHYMFEGAFRGYNPGPNFSSKDYFEANQDVKLKGVNPLAHYELHGKYRGNNTHRTFKNILSFKIFNFLLDERVASLRNLIFNVKDNRIFFYSPWNIEDNGKLNENSQMVYDLLDDSYEKLTYTKKSVGLGEHLKLLKNVCTSKTIVIDTGWSIFSRLDLKDNQRLINIWHACGAFKKIAYDVGVYSEDTLLNFKRQFSQYDNFIVSSESIVPIYANAHGMEEKKVLPLGVPRTDIFFDKEIEKENLNKLYDNYPILKDKEVILYVPTFRDEYALKTGIGWDELSENLGSDKIFVIKRHPIMDEDLLNGKTYDNIIYIEDQSLFALMFATDLMITDYSSVIFEYSLLNKPLIHYCPDFNIYIKDRGFYLDFDNDLYGDIIRNPDELVKIIGEGSYVVNEEALKKFKEKFMSNCDGKSSERVVELIEQYME